jgi:hypothetical protein
MTMAAEYHDKREEYETTQSSADREEQEYADKREMMFEKLYDPIWVECYSGKWDDGTMAVLKEMITIIDKALNR